VLGGETSLERYRQMRAGMDDQGNINRYSTILGDTMGTSKMVARTTLQEFNVALIDLGGNALPLAIAGVKGLSGALGWVTNLDEASKKVTEQHRHLGLPFQRHDIIPKAWNWMFGDKPAVPPGEGVLKPQPQSFTDGPMRAQPMNFLQGPPKPTVTHTAFSFNVDGRTLAQTLIEQIESLSEHATSAPSYNGLQAFNRADGGLATS
jgi:hypothetical protein